jgi:hypothetical protein
VSGQRSQLALLLKVALQVDLRSRGHLPGRRFRGTQNFVLVLVFYVFIGLVLSISLVTAGLPSHLFLSLLYAVAGVFVTVNILLEYQEILLAPADADVLFWRPIPSRTLFLGKVLHIVVYVAMLTVALLLVPAVVVTAVASAHRALVFAAFWTGGLLNALAAASLTILLYGVLLRLVSPERLQDLLAYVQLAFSMLVFFGYQMLGPLVEKYRLGDSPSVQAWYPFAPPAWFAAIPAAAAEPSSRLFALVGFGIVSLAAAGAYALGRLAPGYEQAIAAVGAATSAGGPALRSPRRRVLEDLFGSLVAREPMRRAGYDFFMGNLRGDRKIMVSLLPNVGVPLAMLAYALVLGYTADPYGGAGAGGAAAVQVAPPAPTGAVAPPGTSGGGAADLPGGAHGPAADARHRVQSHRPSVFHLYMPVYFLALLGAMTSRIISMSASWRASWVFHAAPLRRFDRFYAGVLWGVVYGLLLPAVALVALTLLVVWRNPLHVAAHLALPCAIAILSFPLAMQFDVAPPFSREPQRNQRSRDMLLSFLFTGLLGSVGFLQWALRGHPAELVGLGLALSLVALSVWSLANRRIRTVMLTRSFEG